MNDVLQLGTAIPLVGRRDELAALTGALARAKAGQAGGVLLSGDAGIGKSRLLTELATQARADGFEVLVGRCLDASEATLPYLPFSEALSMLATHHDTDLLAAHPALARLLPGAPHAEQGGVGRDLGQLQLFDAMLSVLTELSARVPTLLVLEDVHWSDRSSRDLLAFLLSRLGRQRLTVLASYRADELHRRHPLRPVLAELMRLPTVQRLHLAPFPAAQARDFVRALADGSLTEARLSDIARRSEGNAFFAEELLSASGDDVPRDLADVLLARTERLSPATQQVLRLASVAGRRVRHAQLRVASGLPAAELDEALREAVTGHVLIPDGDSASEGSYAFRHDLLRDAIYTDLLPGERTRWHAVFADTLAHGDICPGTAAELAHHAMESHDLPRALAASVQAAREADTLNGPAEVLLHTERALTLWHAVPDAEAVTGLDQLRLTRWAAWAASATGDPDRALAHSRDTMELADAGGDRMKRSEARRRYAEYLLDVAGMEAESERTAQEAFDLVADEPPSAERARALAVLARTSWRLDRPDRCAERAQQAIAAARAAPAGPQTTSAEIDALISMAVSDETRGWGAQARQRLVEAAELARRSEAFGVELRAHYNHGMSYMDEGRLVDAVEAFATGVSRAEETGLTWSSYGLEVRVVSVLTRFMIGDWDGAEEAAEPGGESVSTAVATRLSAASLLTAVARGRLEIAERRIAELREPWPADDQVVGLVGQCGIESALWRGRPAQAVERADAALRWLQTNRQWPLLEIALSAIGIAAHAELAQRAARRRDAATRDAAVAAGEALAERAAEVFARGTPRAAAVGPEARAWLLRVEAETSRLRGASDPQRWAAAAEAFHYGEVYREAQARWRWAEALLERGDTAEGAEQLRAALATAERLAAHPLAEALRAMAKRARIALDGDGEGDRSAAVIPNMLTPREQSVLALVAEGHTNRQIGAALFISEKTVSVHLSRVMAKLEVGSRTEAVSAAYERGLLTAST